MQRTGSCVLHDAPMWVQSVEPRCSHWGGSRPKAAEPRLRMVEAHAAAEREAGGTRRSRWVFARCALRPKKRKL